MGLAPRRYSLTEFYAPLTIMRLEGEPSGLGGGTDPPTRAEGACNFTPSLLVHKLCTQSVPNMGYST